MRLRFSTHCSHTPTVGGPTPQGAQLKINVLLRRLPKLRDPTIAPGVAFSGTFHVHEGFDNLARSHRQAAAGSIPTTPPCEIYCHTLSDPSILGPALDGMHTLTLFGLHMPPELFTAAGAKDQAVQSTLAALDSVLDEPIADVIAVDINGDPCIEAKTPLELQNDVGSARWQHLPPAAAVAVGTDLRSRGDLGRGDGASAAPHRRSRSPTGRRSQRNSRPQCRRGGARTLKPSRQE